MTERWRDIPGFEGAYQVSDLGRVRSYRRASIHGRVLRPYRLPSGHYKVDLRKNRNGKRTCVCVHALVMLAFTGPYPEGLEVRHLNGIPSDNRLINLEYATRSRNLLDIKWHGGRANRRLTPQDVLYIKQQSGPHGTGRILARKYGVSPSMISAIRRGHVHKDVDADKFDDEIGFFGVRGRQC
jgi:hypothetical protein